MEKDHIMLTTGLDS